MIIHKAVDVPVLPTDVLRQIRRLHLRARRLVRTSLGGEYHSAFKGSGLTFDDVRAYQPGDDVRRIDWNVTARVGAPFVKRYVEERELTVVLVLDCSSSLRFGTGGQSKRSVAAEAAAVLAVCAAGNNDRVGLLAYSDRVERYVPPGKGGRHVLRLLREVLFFDAKGPKTDLAAALEFLNRVHRRRAILFFVSDFLGGIPEDSFLRTTRRHDAIAVRVSDARERTWPDAGFVRLTDAESGDTRLVDTTSASFRATFAARAASRRAGFEDLCRKSQSDLIDLDTDGGHFDAILRFFRHRERRIRGR